MKKRKQLSNFKGNQLSRKEAQQIVGGVKVRCRLSDGGS